MGDYTKRVGRKRHGPRGAKPAEEGVGFEVEFMRVPGQENNDDPVMAYRVIDRHDGVVVFNGVEVESKAKDLANRQIFLLTKASGMAGESQLIETEIEPPSPENETPEETERRLSLEESCAALGKELADGLPDGIGMTLIMFHYGEGGNLAYLSTAKRPDMLATMRDFLAKHGAAEQ